MEGRIRQVLGAGYGVPYIVPELKITDLSAVGSGDLERDRVQVFRSTDGLHENPHHQLGVARGHQGFGQVETRRDDLSTESIDEGGSEGIGGIAVGIDDGGGIQSDAIVGDIVGRNRSIEKNSDLAIGTIGISTHGRDARHISTGTIGVNEVRNREEVATGSKRGLTEANQSFTAIRVVHNDALHHGARAIGAGTKKLTVSHLGIPELTHDRRAGSSDVFNIHHLSGSQPFVEVEIQECDPR